MKTAPRYVLGFLFNRTMSEVVLIRKNRPAWQAGLYNGIGGHIELGETDNAAMVREFAEETGARTEDASWQRCLTMKRDGELSPFTVEVFRCIADQETLAGCVKTNEDQPVRVVLLSQLGNLPRVSNLDWLIHMLRDRNPGDCPSYSVLGVVGEHTAHPTWLTPAFATDDELFAKAVDYVLTEGKGGVGMIQRRLVLGYCKASLLVDRMVAAGLLGQPADKSCLRPCLMTREEWAVAASQPVNQPTD